ncbi:MAG: CBS domain-containing protein [Rhodothermales bacterium]
MLKDKDFQLFNDSLERCLEGNQFIEEFYDRFMHSSHQIAALFAHTDMERQYRMLRGSIYMCMLAAKNHIQVRGRLSALGDRHNEMGVRPLYYSFWLESLLETVRTNDPRFSDQIEDVWRAIMAPGIRLLVSRYTGPDEALTLVRHAGLTDNHPVKRVRDVMSAPVITVHMDDSLQFVSGVLERHGIHHVVVMDEQRVAGVISDRDVKLAMSPYVGTMGEQDRDVRTLERRAHQVMSRQIVSVTPEASVEEAGHLLVDRNVSCLPVLDAEDDRLVGIVSWRDMLRYDSDRVRETDRADPPSTDGENAGSRAVLEAD